MSDLPELKPCPFCGRDDLFINYYGEVRHPEAVKVSIDGGLKWKLKNPDHACPLDGKDFGVEYWNRRADLAGGYSEQQLAEQIRNAQKLMSRGGSYPFTRGTGGTAEFIAKLVSATLTPAQPRDPAVLVGALEMIPERCGTGSEAAQIAREALEKWGKQ